VLEWNWKQAWRNSLKMLKPFSPLSNILFVTNHALCNVAFIYFLNWYDTGLWDSDGWIFMALGGILCGALALLLEYNIYRRFNLWSHNSVLFFTRLITLSILFITMSLAISYIATFIVDWLTSGSSTTTALLVVIPFMALFYLPMIIPFGVILGFINGTLLQLVHVSSVVK